MRYPYIWFWRKRPTDSDRKGHPCRVLISGKKNSRLIEFEDGFRMVASRYGLRKRRAD